MLMFLLIVLFGRYSYVMRPDTLPPSYWKFIVNTGEPFRSTP